MGTSWATAIVAAVAATNMSQEPRLKPEEVIESLKTCGVLHPGMRDRIAGRPIDLKAILKTGTDR